MASLVRRPRGCQRWEAPLAKIDLAVRDPGIKSRVREIGRLIRAEDGVSNAVALIEKFGRER